MFIYVNMFPERKLNSNILQMVTKSEREQHITEMI